MVQETASPEEPSPLPATPAVEEKPIAEEPEQEEEEGKLDEQALADEAEPPDREAEPAPTTVAFSKDDFEDSEDFKTFVEETLDEGRWQGQKREAGQRNQLLQGRQELSESIEGLRGTFGAAAAAAEVNGETFAKLMRDNAPGLARYAAALERNQQADTQITKLAEWQETSSLVLANAMTMLASHPSIKLPNDVVGPFLAQIVQASGQPDANGNYALVPTDDYRVDGGRRAWNLFAKAMASHLADKFGKPAQKKGVRQGKTIATELAKNALRDGQGPHDAEGTASGSSRPTVAQWAAATPDKRAEWKEKGIEPLV